MTVAGIIMTCFIGSFFVVGMLSSRMERRQKLFEEEEKLHKKTAEEQTKQDNLLFISSVAALLPDSDSALNKLNERYGWEKILRTIRLSSLHLTILRVASYDKKVTLPNMQAERYEASERQVAGVVRNTTSTYDNVGFYGVDAYAQEPTVEMLRDLVGSGYITTATPITKNSRDFMCKLTPKGFALLNLDKCFRKRSRSQLYLYAISEDELQIITKVMFAAFRNFESNNDGQTTV